MGNLAIDVSLKPSRSYAIFLLVIYGATFFLFIFLQLPFVFLLGALAVYIFLGFRAWRHWEFYARVSRLRISDTGFSLVTPAGVLDFTSGLPVYIGPRLMILKLTSTNKTEIFPLFSDSAEQNQLRRLRVWLNCNSKSPL